MGNSKFVAGVCLIAGATMAADGPSLADRHRDAAARLIGAALVSDRAYETLGELSDNYGHRLSGSATLEAAIDWAVARMKADGLTDVHREEVMVPAWVRGAESAELLAPARRRLNMLGLGRSVGTPAGGIEAEVVVVSSFDELDALGSDGVRGKIVLFDVPFTTYGATVKYRGNGPSRAATLGAVAALVRSVGPHSLDTPHTGALRYADDAPKIPAAAITVENAAMMHRMAERGDTLRMRLEMAAKTLPDAPSANVIAEVRGSELPDEIVVIGGHIDSWDVGQGAQDDGVGCVIAWEAARLILTLDLKPRRTIRVVLFTNEENGLAGGKNYAERRADTIEKHVAAIESDSGNGLANGFNFDVPLLEPKPEDKTEAKGLRCAQEIATEAKTMLDAIAPLLEPLGATEMTCGGSGADVGPLVKRGVAGLGLNHDTSEYFHIHHTWADTFDKIDKADLNKNVAMMAVMAYVLAEMDGRLLPPMNIPPEEPAAVAQKP